MKTHLAANAPVLVGIDVYPSFDHASGPQVISGNGVARARGYHAIVLIGYDDVKKMPFASTELLGIGLGRPWPCAWIDYDTPRFHRPRSLSRGSERCSRRVSNIPASTRLKLLNTTVLTAAEPSSELG